MIVLSEAKITDWHVKVVFTSFKSDKINIKYIF